MRQLRNSYPRLELDWLYEVFRWVRSDLERIAPQDAQKNLNTGIVSNLEIPLPPLDVQRAICRYLAQSTGIDRITTAVRDELAAVDALPAALLREAFAGDA